MINARTSFQRWEGPLRTTSVLTMMSCSACLRAVNAASRYPTPSGMLERILASARNSACMKLRR
ncbi:hypothetical protein D3C83_110120 [compost metagenome]